MTPPQAWLFPLMWAAVVGTGCGRDPARGEGPAPAVRADAPARPAPRADAAAAVPIDAPADANALVARPSARCQGLPATAQIETLPVHDEVRGFDVRGDHGHWLVLDGAKGCTVLPVGRADARTRGELWPGAPELKAFALRDPACDDDDDARCMVFVAVRDDAGAVLDVVPTCTATLEISLHRARFFADHDSLIVSCVDHTGYGLVESLVLLDAGGGALREVLRVAGGWGDHGPGECAPCGDGYCWTLLDGARWKVLARSATPELETLTPVTYPERAEPDRKRAPNQIRWRFDRDAGRFVATHRGVISTTAAANLCAPKPLASPLR